MVENAWGNIRKNSFNKKLIVKSQEKQEISSPPKTLQNTNLNEKFLMDLNLCNKYLKSDPEKYNRKTPSSIDTTNYYKNIDLEKNRNQSGCNVTGNSPRQFERTKIIHNEQLSDIPTNLIENNRNDQLDFEKKFWKDFQTKLAGSLCKTDKKDHNLEIPKKLEDQKNVDLLQLEDTEKSKFLTKSTSLNFLSNVEVQAINTIKDWQGVISTIEKIKNSGGDVSSLKDKMNSMNKNGQIDNLVIEDIKKFISSFFEKEKINAASYENQFNNKMLELVPDERSLDLNDQKNMNIINYSENLKSENDNIQIIKNELIYQKNNSNKDFLKNLQELESKKDKDVILNQKQAIFDEFLLTQVHFLRFASSSNNMGFSFSIFFISSIC